MHTAKTSTNSGLSIAVVVPGLRVADVAFNSAEIRRVLQPLLNSNPDWIVFPRLCLTGATCGDLFRQELLQEAAMQALIDLAPLTNGSRSKVLLGLPLAIGQEVYEGLALLSSGCVEAVMVAPSPQNPPLAPATNLQEPVKGYLAGEMLPLLIKTPYRFGNEEVLMGFQPPSEQETDLLINLLTLPALAPALETPQTMFDPANRSGVTVICSAGASESSTDQVFSGKAEIWQNGICIQAAPELSFTTQIIQAVCEPLSAQPLRSEEVSVKNSEPVRFPFIRDTEPEKQFSRLFEIQSTGLMRRLTHTRQLGVVLGLSGGADSSHALLVCCRAFDRLGLDRKNIQVIQMPGPGSSSSSRVRAVTLADLSSAVQRVIPIGPALAAHLADISHPQDKHDVTYENAQARERTQILMDIANQQNALLVGTGDLSEIALGWSTFNGDHMSMYNVNCGLPKTLLLRLLVWSAGLLFGQPGESVAREIVQAPISPELLPLDAIGETNQKTEEILGPYELHDFFLYYGIGRQMTPGVVFNHALECFEGVYTPAEILTTLKTFYRRFFSQQFKRSASPDGPQLLEISLSPRSGWRMPSDASSALWLEAIEKIQLPGIHA